MVRHGSKQRRVPAALTPGGGGPGSPRTDIAQVHVPISGQRISAHHPYANVGAAEDDTLTHPPYGRASPMMPSAAVPPAISNIKAAGISQGTDYHGHDDIDMSPKPSLWRILTCRC
jgi:casein kinase 1